MYMANHRYAVLKIGPFLAVHCAVLPHIADKYTIPQINQLQRDFLTGKGFLQPQDDCIAFCIL